MIGTHGIVAIVGTIFMVRAVRALWYLDKQQSFIANIIIASVIGAASVYFYAEIHDAKAIIGGAVMTPITSMVAYEIIKFLLGFAYEKTKIETLRALFFFLSPKPIKTKVNGMTEEIPPHSELTRIFEKTRLDK